MGLGRCNAGSYQTHGPTTAGRQGDLLIEAAGHRYDPSCEQDAGDQLGQVLGGAGVHRGMHAYTCGQRQQQAN
jgi:hypothetical protein